MLANDFHPSTPSSMRESFNEHWLMSILHRMFRSDVDPFDYLDQIQSTNLLATADPTAGLATHASIRDRIINAPAELQSLLRDHTANTFKRKLETAMAEDTRLFRTSHHHLGLGRPSMQPHDELWILARAPTPYLLRKIEGRDGRYIIVGDCYVRGIMHGEAVRDQQKWEKILIGCKNGWMDE
jgi:hypothetical protein